LDRSSLEAESRPRSAPARRERVRSALARRASDHDVVVWLLAVITVILTAAALKASAPVSMPLAFAYFLAVLVYPLQVWLGDHLPARLRLLAVPLTMLAVVAVLALALALLAIALQLAVSGAPQYADRLEQRLTALQDFANRYGIQFPQGYGLDGESLRTVSEQLLAGLTSLGTISLFAILIFFFALLMLLEARDWRRKTAAALRDSRTDVVLDAVASIGQKVRKYLWIRTLAGLISGIAAGLWLWLLGVDFALLWGVLFFLLNYVPNIGSLVAGIPPTLLAFLELGFGWALLAAGGLLAIDQFIGNYLDPRLLGRTLNISSLVVLISVIFWGWIWGVIGTLLAVPMTATIMIACEHVPALRPIAIFMSGGNGESERA
jgi:predicted PurR-regulated permease PerM